jgi:hypothetical protein
VSEYREGLPSGVAPERYLRVLANPFLACAGLVAWLLVVDWLRRLYVRDPQLMGPLAPLLVILALVGLFGLVPRLLHFHCLDCGRTGPLSRWREHSCSLSNLRRQAVRPRRLRGPSPFVQVILWLWALLWVLSALHGAGWRWPDSG